MDSRSPFGGVEAFGRLKQLLCQRCDIQRTRCSSPRTPLIKKLLVEANSQIPEHPPNRISGGMRCLPTNPFLLAL